MPLSVFCGLVIAGKFLPRKSTVVGPAFAVPNRRKRSAELSSVCVAAKAPLSTLVSSTVVFKIQVVLVDQFATEFVKLPSRSLIAPPSM